jgi:hypothetical protein
MEFFLCCPIMCLYISSSVLWCPLRFWHKNDVHLYLQLFVWGLMSFLHYLCLVAYSGYVFLRFVYPMLPFSLDCPFLIAPSVFSNVYLTIKTSASLEACIVLLNILIRIIFWLSMLITFCIFSDYARNSSIFDLKHVSSVNNALFLTAVPARLRCVISLVDYLLLCVVKSLFLCVDIYFMCYFSHFLLLYIDVCFFVDFFHYTIVFKFALL